MKFWVISSAIHMFYYAQYPFICWQSTEYIWNIQMEGNYTYLLGEYSKDIVNALLPMNILFSIILVSGVIGNVFVIFIYATKMRKDQRESRYFIPVLAFYDLMTCVTSWIYFLSNTFFWASFRSDELCKTLLLFLVQTMMTSDAFLLVVAVQRYIKICRPHAKQMSLFWRRLTIALVIATNIFYSIPTAIVSGVQESPVVYRNVTISGEGCSTGNKRYPLFQLIYYAIVMFILVANIVVTAGMYTPIACVIFRRSRKRRIQNRIGIDNVYVEDSETCSRDTTLNVKPTVGSSKKMSSRNKSLKCIHHYKEDSATAKENPEQLTRNNHFHHRQAKSNFNVMFFVIIFVYMVTYVPTAVMLTYVTLDDTIWTRSSYDAISFYTFLMRSYTINHAANPFIYVYFDSKLRSYVRSLFCSYCATS